MNYITISGGHSIKFPEFNKRKGNVLILGNYRGVCGLPNAMTNFDMIGNGYSYDNLTVIKEALKSKHKVYVIGDNDTIKYFEDCIIYLRDNGCFESELEYKFRGKFGFKRNNEILRKYFIPINTINNNISDACEKIKQSGMKFDTIIQNPPYSRSLHLDFLKKGLDLLNENGKMVIVEPATWLINVRKNGNAKRYDAIKKKLDGHIESIVIENLNKEFGTGLYVPFATTTIDMGKTYETIDCTICGEHKIVESIYDINLVGKYDTIWSILDKVQKFGDVMSNHITNEDKGKDYWYAKYAKIISANGCGGGNRALSDEMYRICLGKDYYLAYSASGFHSDRTSDIQNYPTERRDKGGKKIEGSVADNIYGTKTELENWKHFIFNNKLPLFINIVMTIDQNNNSKEFLPWLVDKQYTDEEIYKMFEFTPEEIALIEKTIKKYERNSPWFKRYMCGKDDADENLSNEKITEWLEELNKVYTKEENA